MKIKSLKRSAAVLAGIFLLYVLWTAWTIWTFPCHENVRADAAIVLGASMHKEQPSPVFVERINHGLALYKQGLVGKLIFTGGTPENESISLAETASRYAVERGIPLCDILLEPYSCKTLENLKYAKQIAGEKGLHTFLIVSDPLHMKRAMRMAIDLRMNARASATPTTKYTNIGSQLRFLSRETLFYTRYMFVTRYLAGRSIEEAEKMEKTRSWTKPLSNQP